MAPPLAPSVNCGRRGTFWGSGITTPSSCTKTGRGVFGRPSDDAAGPVAVAGGNRGWPCADEMRSRPGEAYGSGWYGRSAAGLDAGARARVAEARDMTGRLGQASQSGAVSALSFGFRVSLPGSGGRLRCGRPGHAQYGNTLWRSALRKAFPHAGGHHPKRRPQTRRSSEAAPQQDRAPWGGAGTRAAISSPTPPTGYPCGVRPGRPDTAPRHRAVSRASPSKSSGRSR